MEHYAREYEGKWISDKELFVERDGALFLNDVKSGQIRRLLEIGEISENTEEFHFSADRLLLLTSISLIITLLYV